MRSSASAFTLPPAWPRHGATLTWPATPPEGFTPVDQLHRDRQSRPCMTAKGWGPDFASAGGGTPNPSTDHYPSEPPLLRFSASDPGGPLHHTEQLSAHCGHPYARYLTSGLGIGS
jgi:hypothetical protein